MSNFFNANSLQSVYNSIQGIINTTTMDDAAKQRLLSISQRIARFESALIEDSVTQHNDASRYPYDREGLKREFLDEVFGEIIRAMLPSDAVNMPGTFPNSSFNLISFDASSYDEKLAFLDNYALSRMSAININSESQWRQMVDYAYQATVNKAKAIENWYPLMGPHGTLFSEALAVPSPHNTYAKKLKFIEECTQLGNGWLDLGGQRANNLALLEKTAELTKLKIVRNNETWHQDAVTNHSDLLKKYAELINATFAEGEKLKLGPLDEDGNRIGVNTVVAIAPVSFDVVSLANPSPTSVKFTHVTSISYNVPDPDRPGQVKKLERSFLLPEGFDIASFKPNTSTGGMDIVYPNGQNGGDLPMVLEIETVDVKSLNSGIVPLTHDVNGVERMLLQELPFLPAAGAQAAVVTEHFMNPMDYLFYWNESRVNYFYGQLRYREAIVSEIQEDLRQANLVLAELEKIAGSTRAQAEDGQPNPEAKNETMDMDIWEAINNPATGDPLFDANGLDDSHNHSEWQKNRTNLKNYIDTKSSEAQQAMLDYQTMLNRYNNAFEVMAKLQEKLQNLISSQLRNLN